MVTGSYLEACIGRMIIRGCFEVYRSGGVIRGCFEAGIGGRVIRGRLHR